MIRIPLPASLIPVVLASVVACSDGPTDTRELRAQSVTTAIDGAAIVVRNDGAVPVRIALIERQWGENGLALWCFGSAQCGSALEPGAELRVPVADVEGYRADMSEVLVHWWRPSEANGDGAAPVNTFVVEL